MTEEDIIILADDAHQFFNTELGMWLMAKIDATVEEGRDQFLKVDPYKPDEVQKAQMTIWKADTLKIWFNEIMLEGDQILERRLQEDD